MPSRAGGWQSLVLFTSEGAAVKRSYPSADISETLRHRVSAQIRSLTKGIQQVLSPKNRLSTLRTCALSFGKFQAQSGTGQLIWHRHTGLKYPPNTKSKFRTGAKGKLIRDGNWVGVESRSHDTWRLCVFACSSHVWWFSPCTPASSHLPKTHD